MKVREVMNTKGLLDIGETDSLASAAHRMVWAGCRHLPVTRGNEVVGVLSERDVLAWKADGRALDGPEARVSNAMSAPAMVATPDQSLGEAAARMIASRIGCLPVVMNGTLVGMVTSSDLLARHVSESFEGAAGKDATASVIMTPAVFTAHPGDPLLAAADVMARNRIRHLPVVDEAGRLVGILSERDLRTALGGPSEALAHWKVGQGQDRTVKEIMSEKVVSVRPDEGLDEVITKLASRGVGAVPVVDRDGRPVGIVSYLDVLRALRP